VKFEVIHSQWSADGEVYSGGIHEIDLEPEHAPIFAGAAAAGAITLLGASPTERKLLAGHVESQKASESAYRAAQRDGRWHEGNLQQFELDVVNGVRRAEL
jgi:hypothetical protein